MSSRFDIAQGKILVAPVVPDKPAPTPPTSGGRPECSDVCWKEVLVTLTGFLFLFGGIYLFVQGLIWIAHHI